MDARLLRELLVERRMPEAWSPPAHILDLRARVRLRKTLVDQRTEWLQRIHAVLLHHGVPTQAGRLGRLEGDHAREQLDEPALPHAARQQIEVALAIIEHLNAPLRPLDNELERDARRLSGCRALMAHYGIGAKVATAIVAELGDPRRFSSSRQAVRCAGLEITVHESDLRRRAGTSRQGSPVPRWAVFEAAQTAARPASPDHEHDLSRTERLGANRAALTIARKMLRRAHHTLRALGDDALAPASPPALCTLGLSVIPHRQRAWETMTAAVRPGGRLAIMDAGYPEGRSNTMLARPVAWALSRLFAADCSRRPWRLLQRDACDATTARFTLGWVTAAAGTPTAV